MRDQLSCLLIEDYIDDMTYVMGAFEHLKRKMIDKINKPFNAYTCEYYKWYISPLIYERLKKAGEIGLYILNLEYEVDRTAIVEANPCKVWLVYNDEKYPFAPTMSHFYSNYFKTPFNKPEIKKVISNDPATIVFWKDGTKTVVKCQNGETFDVEKGLAMAICKKVMGTNESKSNFNDIFKKWIPQEETQEYLRVIIPGKDDLLPDDDNK